MKTKEHKKLCEKVTEKQKLGDAYDFQDTEYFLEHS